MTDSIPTELQEQIQAIQALPGRVSLYFENLKSGYRAQYNSTLPTIAASVSTKNTQWNKPYILRT